MLLFTCLVVPGSLWPHGLQHTRPPCPSPALRVCSNSCPLPVMPSNHLCRPFLLLPSIFPSIRVFSKESALCMRWSKYWSFSFSISPSNEYSGVISLGLTGLISLQSEGLSTVGKHQFFSAQPSLRSSSHICTLQESLPWLIQGPSNPRAIGLLKYFRGCYLAKAALSLSLSLSLSAHRDPHSSRGEDQLWFPGQSGASQDVGWRRLWVSRPDVTADGEPQMVGLRPLLGK